MIVEERKIAQLIPFVGEKEKQYLAEAIDATWITEGPFSKRLLQHLKEFTGARYALLTNNGTLGLFLGLLALDLKAGDEVIVPDFTFNASGSSIVFAGAKPVMVDVNQHDYHLKVEDIEQLITPRTKAIMPVHMYGQSADMDPIMAIAKKHNIMVLEDAAQGYGVYYKGKHTGTMGDIGVISFFADKTVTMGEGAVILTNNEQLYKKLQLIRNQGREHSGTFVHPALGMNFRVTDLQCAVGVAQMEKYPYILERKLENHALYEKHLSGYDEIKLIRQLDYCNYVPFRCSIRVKEREALNQHLAKGGLQLRNFFYPLHRQPCFAYLNYAEDAFPNTNSISAEGMSLPVYPNLPLDDIEYICQRILSFYGYVS